MKNHSTRRFLFPFLFLLASLLCWYLYTSYNNDTSWYDDILNFKLTAVDHEAGKYIFSFLSEKGYIKYDEGLPTSNNPEILFYQAFHQQNETLLIKAIEEIHNPTRKFDFALLLLSFSPLQEKPLFSLPANYTEKHFFQKHPFTRGLYHTQVASLPCHLQSTYRTSDLKENAKNGYIDDVAAFVIQMKNGGCYETGLQSKQVREKYSCILKHYMANNPLLNDIYQKHGLKTSCGNQAEEWVQSQLTEDKSFFGKLNAQKIYDPKTFLNPDFFEKDRACFFIPFAEYSKDLRTTAYFKKCITP